MEGPPTRPLATLSDRYRILRELGAGGMAIVYLADDLRHHRPVAIKVHRPELAAALGPDRFLTEIRTTAGLRHLREPDISDGPSRGWSRPRPVTWPRLLAAFPRRDVRSG